MGATNISEFCLLHSRDLDLFNFISKINWSRVYLEQEMAIHTTQVEKNHKCPSQLLELPLLLLESLQNLARQVNFVLVSKAHTRWSFSLFTGSTDNNNMIRVVT